MVTVRVPAPQPGLATNLLGVAGLVAIVVAVGALADWRWALLLAGVLAVVLCWVGQQHRAAAEVAAPVPARQFVARDGIELQHGAPVPPKLAAVGE